MTLIYCILIPAILTLIYWLLRPIDQVSDPKRNIANNEATDIVKKILRCSSIEELDLVYNMESCSFDDYWVDRLTVKEFMYVTILIDEAYSEMRSKLAA